MKNTALFAIAMMLGAAGGAQAYNGEAMEKKAHIKMDKASAIALKARPGTITDRELEREKGGSGLRYSFDITAAKVKYEVGVDAMTGALLENAREGANPD